MHMCFGFNSNSKVITFGFKSQKHVALILVYRLLLIKLELVQLQRQNLAMLMTL